MSKRRQLDFASMEEINSDVERLLRGHVTHGQWTLAQIFYHLAIAIRATGVGRAGSTAWSGTPEFRRQFFESRRFPEGIQAPHPRLVPPEDADLSTQADALRSAIALFTACSGPFPNHPLLGPLTKEEWAQFHCIHCAHHLSFAAPMDFDQDTSPAVSAHRSDID